jgi:hypothetical protein
MKRVKQNVWPFASKATSPRMTTPASGGIARHAKKRPAATKARESEAPRALSFDESKLEAHYKRGGTLAEFLRDNPGADRREVTDRAHRYRAQKNVTGARRCVICGSTSDLGVMHLDGNESHDGKNNLAWGCRSCNGILSAAFQRIGAGRPTNQYNPAGGKAPTFEQYAFAVSNHTRNAHDEGGAIIHATPKSKRIEYARRIAGLKAERGRSRDDERWNPAEYYLVADGRTSPVSKQWSREDAEAKAAALNEKRRVAGKPPIYGVYVPDHSTRTGYKSNPASAAADAYQDFHGKPPDEFVEVKERVHTHRHLSSAGELERLKIAAIDGRRKVTLVDFGGALLAFSEKRNQLFVKGGDQSVDLKSFGIDPREAHEVETLGKVLELDYFTDKKHLGSEGGVATYRHKMRTTNENGRHVTVRIARYPDLIYRVRDKQLEFSGGSYTIIPEGIDR